MNYRHGDVILIETKQEFEAPIQNEIILAKGEVTGHAHRLRGQVSQIETEDAATLLRIYHERAKLFHEEHGEIEIPEGVYEMKIQREYDGSQEIRVMD